MDAVEITRMACLENDHWWYRSLRDLIRRTLAMPGFKLPARPRIIDAGCGTGANLSLLEEILEPAYLGGFDVSPLAINFSRRRTPDADLYVSDLRDPQVRCGELDLALSCDVLSIAGIEDCHAGLARLVGRLRRGGLLILNLPAFDWLRSDHDVAIGTRDRVTAGQVSRLLTRLGLEVGLITYRLCFVFPAILAARLPSMLGRRRNWRSDLRATPARLNAALGAICLAENQAICRGVKFPFGSSVYAVGRKG